MDYGQQGGPNCQLAIALKVEITPLSQVLYGKFSCIIKRFEYFQQ
jgi:hypothetical protein